MEKSQKVQEALDSLAIIAANEKRRLERNKKFKRVSKIVATPIIVTIIMLFLVSAACAGMLNVVSIMAYNATIVIVIFWSLAIRDLKKSDE